MLVVPDIRKLDELLSQYLKGNWKYIQHTSDFLIAAGENYGSIMLKINVKIEENCSSRELKLVGKLCPPSAILKEAFLTSITFIKEAKSYLDSHPFLEEFQNEYGISECKRLDVFAKCYGARINLTSTNVVDEDAIILLENLKVQGYTIEDRFKGMDFNSTKLIIKNLARLNGIYIAIRLKKPLEFHKLMLPSLKNINNGGILMNSFINTALYFIKSIEECKKYIEPLTKMIEFRKSLNGLKFPVESDKNFYSFVHGDLWTNNIMILKNDKNLPTNLKIVDLQLLNYGSPVRDLIFFLYTSVQIEVCEKHFDYFVRYYYENLFDCLNDFKCPTENYSWNAFVKEINLVAPHELFHIIFMLKPIFSERGSIFHLGDMKMEDFENVDNVGETYIKKLTHIILSFAKKKWI